MADQQEEMIQSAASYGVGGGGIVAATLVEISHYAEAIALIAGCALVIVRLVHDVHRYLRFRGRG